MSAVSDIPEPELRARLAASHVAVLGCGGLGSNVAAMLVRSGVGTLTLVDFDVVEQDNLNRQMFFADQIGHPKVDALVETLRRIDSAAALHAVRERITAENIRALVAHADVVVEAVDSAATKTLIADSLTVLSPPPPLVMVSGLAGYDSANLIATEQLADDLWVIGDLSSDATHGHALLASRVMVAAAHEAHAVIRLLLGLDPA